MSYKWKKKRVLDGVQRAAEESRENMVGTPKMQNRFDLDFFEVINDYRNW